MCSQLSLTVTSLSSWATTFIFITYWPQCKASCSSSVADLRFNHPSFPQMGSEPIKENFCALIMVALWNRADHYILPCGFFYLSFFSSPNLSRHRLDVCHTSTHRWNTGRKKVAKKSPSGHQRTTLSRYIFATKANIDNRKKLVKQQYVLHMSS